jgi:uncharacterized membrane protein
MPRPGALVAAAALVVPPVAIHFLTLAESARPVAVALGWAAAAALAVALAHAAGVGLAEAAAVAATLGLAAFVGAGTKWAVFLPSAAINLLLAWFFGRTLVRGRTPLVTALARVVRGVSPLPPELERYTRRVTWAWSLFFAATVAVSAALAAFAPLATWSLFANVLAAPLVAAMFAGEYAYRRWRLAAYEHVPLRTIVGRLAAAGFAIVRPPAK